MSNLFNKNNFFKENDKASDDVSFQEKLDFLSNKGEVDFKGIDEQQIKNTIKIIKDNNLESQEDVINYFYDVAQEQENDTQHKFGWKELVITTMIGLSFVSGGTEALEDYDRNITQNPTQVVQEVKDNFNSFSDDKYHIKFCNDKGENCYICLSSGDSEVPTENRGSDFERTFVFAAGGLKEIEDFDGAFGDNKEDMILPEDEDRGAIIGPPPEDYDKLPDGVTYTSGDDSENMESDEILDDEDIPEELDDEDIPEELDDEDMPEELDDEDMSEELDDEDIPEELDDEDIPEELDDEDIPEELDDEDIPEELDDEDIPEELDDEDIPEEEPIDEESFEEESIEEDFLEEDSIDEEVFEEESIEEDIPEEEPIVEEPVIEEPIIEEPVVEETVVEEPIVETSSDSGSDEGFSKRVQKDFAADYINNQIIQGNDFMNENQEITASNIDIFRDKDTISDILKDFKQDNWNDLSSEERKECLTNLKDYIQNTVGIENPPELVFYNNEDPGDYAYVTGDGATLAINEFNLWNSNEAADSIAHELWHAYQQQRAQNPQTATDYMYADGFENYISADLDPVGYEDQFVESDAREFAQRFKDFIEDL